MRSLYITAGIILLVGCAVVVPEYVGDRRVVLELVEDLGTMQGVTINGKAWWWDTLCYIKMLESTYPVCLEHELFHCAEGHWHDPLVPNGQFCNETPLK